MAKWIRVLLVISLVATLIIGITIGINYHEIKESVKRYFSHKEEIKKTYKKTEKKEERRSTSTIIHISKKQAEKETSEEAETKTEEARQKRAIKNFVGVQADLQREVLKTFNQPNLKENKLTGSLVHMTEDEYWQEIENSYLVSKTSYGPKVLEEIKGEVDFIKHYAGEIAFYSGYISSDGSKTKQYFYTYKIGGHWRSTSNFLTNQERWKVEAWADEDGKTYIDEELTKRIKTGWLPMQKYTE